MTSLVERVSRFAVLLRNNDRHSKPIMDGLVKVLQALPFTARRSITFDRGTEFTDWPYLQAGLGTQTWFCDPQSPWQKGTVENTNRRVRKWLSREVDPHELFALLIFLIVAVLTGSLAGRIRYQAQDAVKKSTATQALYDFSRKLSASAKVEEVLWVSVNHAHKTLGGKAILLLPNEGGLEVQSVWPPDEPLNAAELGAARWALDKGEPTGWQTGTLPNVRFRFQPLSTSNRIVGIFGYQPVSDAVPVTADEERALSAIAVQTAIAADRALLVADSVRLAAFQDNQRTLDTLLTSLSHDLRAPLASINDTVSLLLESDKSVSDKQRHELLRSIKQESTRLRRLISGLLEMSRIESGVIKIKRDWVNVSETVLAAVARSKKVNPEHTTMVSLANDLPFICGDADLLEQVMFNLLDNAHKYGGETEVRVHARYDKGDMLISVTDDGPGIKPANLERIFEKFFRVSSADGRKAGTGPGLSICRGLVESMGGTITAESPAARRRGTRLSTRFPAAKAEAGQGAHS